MQASNPVWPIQQGNSGNSTYWLQNSETFFSPSTQAGVASKHPLHARFYTDAWRCVSCAQSTPSQLPAQFNFCPKCGMAKSTPTAHAVWMPPNGHASNERLTHIALNRLQAKPVHAEFVRPGPGSFVFAYGYGGLHTASHIAFDLLGALWVWNDTSWKAIAPKGELLPKINLAAEWFTAPELDNGWVLPTQDGPVHLSIDASTAQYELNTAPQSHCLGSAALLDGRAYLPTLSADTRHITVFDAGQWSLLPVSCDVVLPPTLHYGIPIVDAARRHIIWVAADHFILLQLGAAPQATVYPLRAGVHAALEFGSPYQELSTGHWWQQVYDTAQGYGFQKLSTAIPTPLDWKALDAPVSCIAHFTTRVAAYTQREPWVEGFYADLDSQDFGFKLPLLQTKQSDYRGAALYLQVPFDGALDDFYKNTESMFACELRVTGVAQTLCQLAVRQPWRVQVWGVGQAVYISHPDIHDIKCFEVSAT